MTETAPHRKARVGLGRGLNALLGDIAQEATLGAEPAPGHPAGLRILPIGALAPHPLQPRRYFDESALNELADSIATRGLIQPIVARPHGSGYQIIAGERRWRAAQRARLHEVPVIVRDFADDEALEVALIENIQRQDLNAIEEAEAYHRLIAEFGHTQDELGKLVHKSRSHVANLMRLLDLPHAVQTRVIDGSLSMGHARALIGADDIEALAYRIISEGLSVRDAERLAQAAKPSQTRAQRPRDTHRDADIHALEQQLADMLGLVVHIQHKANGGTLKLSYSTLDQLDMVCQRLSGERI